MEATAGIEPADKGFADLCLTTWLRRLTGGTASVVNRLGSVNIRRSRLRRGAQTLRLRRLLHHARFRRRQRSLQLLGLVVFAVFDHILQELDDAPSLCLLRRAPLAALRLLVRDLELQSRHRRRVVVRIELSRVLMRQYV